MRKLLTVFCFCIPEYAVANSVIGGVVVADHYECNTYDRIVIATRRGFTNAEVYSGYGATVEGRVVFGELHSYGFTDVYDDDGREVGRLYIDDYLVGEDTAAEWCYGE